MYNYRIMKKRILTGDRPTGKLHLGHYVGSLKNRIRLQNEYECYFIIADLHTLTTRPEKTDELSQNIRDLVLDYLSVGIDPAKATIYLQSAIPEVCELAIIFGNLISVPRLERVPTLKDVMADAHIKTPSLGLLGYPVLQAADILMVKGELVPVGKDQSSHIEVTREIAREFNRLYPSHSRLDRESDPHFREDDKDRTGVFPVPEVLIPEDIGTLPGTDGRTKMSKSAGNVINLSDDSATVRNKVMGMYTDPKRIHGDEPGEIEGNPVFVYLDAFSQSEKSKSKVKELKKRYANGTVKDVEVKEFLAEVLEKFLTPIRENRARFERDPELVERILKVGTQKARLEAQKTLAEVKSAMKLDL